MNRSKILNDTSETPFKVDILTLQPSQLYINEDKFQKVKELALYKDKYILEPLPIKKLDEQIILTDGHTRALYSYLKGEKQILVKWDDPWDSENLDLEMYQSCVNWCIDSKIFSVKDLEDKIISNNQYEVLWLERCRELQEKLSYKEDI